MANAPGGRDGRPVTIFGPDFPFPFDDWMRTAPAWVRFRPNGTGKKSPSSAPASPAWSPPTS
jgi:hypothetical protein